MSFRSITLRCFFVALCVLFGVGFSSVVKADDDDGGFTWQADLGFTVQHRTYVVDSLDTGDGEVSLGLLLSGGMYYEDFFVETSPFSSRPLTLGYTLNKTRSTMLNLVGMSSFGTISEEFQEEGNRLDGIRTRHGSYEIGIEYLKQFADSDMRVRVLHDVLNQHQGFILSIDQSRPIYKTDWLIIPSWGASYISENSVDYYYGVSEEEVTVDRPAYAAGSGWTLTGRIYVERPINKDWTMFGFASYSQFSNSITDSPITSVDNGTHTIALGVLWTF